MRSSFATVSASLLLILLCSSELGAQARRLIKVSVYILTSSPTGSAWSLPAIAC